MADAEARLEDGLPLGAGIPAELGVVVNGLDDVGGHAPEFRRHALARAQVAQGVFLANVHANAKMLRQLAGGDPVTQVHPGDVGPLGELGDGRSQDPLQPLRRTRLRREQGLHGILPAAGSPSPSRHDPCPASRGGFQRFVM